MSRDPYGFPTSHTDQRPMGPLARWGVTAGWLLLDLGVGLCSAAFAAAAWDTPEDPQFIGLFSSPGWGCAGVGTVVAFALGAFRLHPAIQAAASVLLGLGGCVASPLAWFVGLVVLELV